MEEERLVKLYQETVGKSPASVEHLFGGGGSSRKYYIMTDDDGNTLYGVTSKSPGENRAFYNLSRLFASKGLP